jgi:hypothetical protein
VFVTTASSRRMQHARVLSRAAAAFGSDESQNNSQGNSKATHNILTSHKDTLRMTLPPLVTLQLHVADRCGRSTITATLSV